MEPPGGCGDWLAPPPSPPRAHAPGRHDERGVRTFIWPPAGTYTWPSAKTFPWPWTVAVAVDDPPFAVLATEDVGRAQRVRRPLTVRGVDGLVLERDGVGKVAARPGRDQLLLFVHQSGEVAG